MSYALQFIPIIVIGTYDDKSPEDLAKIISNNAFYYIYLVNSFTRLTDLAIDVGEMAGVFQRFVTHCFVSLFTSNFGLKFFKVLTSF